MQPNSSKINHLIKIWPQKTIAGKEWLSQMGFERQLVAARHLQKKPSDQF